MLYIKDPDETIEYLVFKNGKYIKMYRSISYVTTIVIIPFVIGLLSGLLDLDLYVTITNIILYFLIVIFSSGTAYALTLLGIIKKSSNYDPVFIFDFFEHVIKKKDKLHQISGIKYIARKYNENWIKSMQRSLLLLEEYIVNPELKTELLFAGGLYDYLMSLNKKV